MSEIIATFRAAHGKVTYDMRIYDEENHPLPPVQLSIRSGAAWTTDYLTVDELRAFAAQLVAAADACDAAADLPITGA